MVNREALAWAAGYFDGDGCFHSQMDKRPLPNRRGYCFIRATVHSIDKELLDRFAAVVGVGKVKPTRRDPNEAPRKMLWEWRVQSFRDVQHVGASLWPWLGSYRRDQLTRLLLLARSRPAARLSKRKPT